MIYEEESKLIAKEFKLWKKDFLEYWRKAFKELRHERKEKK
jgi:hypothetical protein